MKGQPVPASITALCPAGLHSARLTRRSLLSGLAALGLLTVLSGCTAGRNSASGGGNGAGGTTAAVSANTLRYPLFSEPTNLDPARVEDGDTIDMLQNVFEGLVQWNDKSEIVPNLAEKWDVSGDGLTYTFHLAHGVKFHNGREMTAQDVKYSLDRACLPATLSTTVQSYLDDIVGAKECFNGGGKVTEVAGVKVVDPYTVSITIDAPKAYWLGKMTYPTGYVVCKEAIEKTPGRFGAEACVGTGPFAFAEYTEHQQCRLTANHDYHGEKPKIDGILRPIITDGTTRLNKYANGELDVLIVSPTDVDRIEGDAKLKPDLHEVPRAATWYIAMNQAAPNSPFGKKEVRQAFAYAIDRREIVRVAMKGKVDVAEGIVPPGMGQYTSKFDPIPFDPAKAKALLAQAGYPDGKGFPTLQITYRNDKPEVAQTAQIVAQQLKTNLGISVQATALEWAEFLKNRTAKTMPLSHLRWGADYLDPQDYLSTLLHTSKLVNGQEDHPENGVGYSNPTFDKLCDEADVEPNPTARIAKYQQAEQIAVNDAPWVPLYFQQDLQLIRPRVGGLRNSLLGILPHTTTTLK